MTDDPIVAEVRRVRDAHAARFGYDAKAIAADLKSREGKDGRRVLNPPPKRVLASKA